MLLKPLQTNDRDCAPSPRKNVAVLVNANAGKVSRRVITDISRLVGKQNVYVSHDELELHRVARLVVAREYPTVFLGGGDGTVMAFVNAIARESKARKSPLPTFGVLKLGTGNSMAEFVTASAPKHVARDISQTLSATAASTRHIEFLDVDGKCAPFAGLGVDGALLNDYNWLKQALGRGPVGGLFRGSLGYFLSVTTRTLPRALRRQMSMDCSVTNGNATAYRMLPEGSVGETYAPGETLYSGPLMMAAAGTTPFYGYGLRMFPFAQRKPGMFNLRLGNVPPLSVVANVRKLWAGTWFPDGIKDVLASEVVITFQDPVPFHVAGDALGNRKRIRIGISKTAIDLIDLGSRALA